MFCLTTLQTTNNKKMVVNPSTEYQINIIKAKSADTEEEYQKYLSIAIHFLEKIEEHKLKEVS
ncbi:hypothetical protein KR49_06855 [Synechococcus sp. KORDI-49]|nr:hypothetical protein KR49_06855 [Synechococcus sp. KORDI-49]